MRKTKKTIAGLMAFAMVLSVASCGNNNSDSNSGNSSTVSDNSSQGDNNTPDASQIALKSFKAIPIENDLSIEYFETIEPLSDDTFLIKGSDTDGNSAMYVANKDFTEFTAIDYTLEADDNAEIYYNAIAQQDGTILLLVNITTHGDMEKPDYDDPDFNDEDFDWEAYYDAAETTYKIVNIDTNGTVISENDLTGLDEYFDEDEQTYLSIHGCGDGAIIEVGGTESEEVILKVGKDGKITGKVEFDDEDDIYNIYTNVKDKDGNLCYSTYGDEHGDFIIKKIDSESLQTEDFIQITGSSIDYINFMFPGSGDYEFYLSSTSSLYGVKADGVVDEIINWLDSDLDGSSVRTVVPVENGEFIIYENNYQGTQGFSRLTKRDASELENVQILTMVAQYVDSSLTDKINQFNKSNDKYRIKVEDYGQYYEWNDESMSYDNTPAKQLQLDIAAGKTFDILCMSSSDRIVRNLGKTGALADMYEFMGKDGTVSKDDILPNVLEAGEMDGKLISVAPNFNVSALAVKKKFCDKENWTVDDLIETYNNCPDGMSYRKYNASKTSAFMELVMSSGVIDYDNAKCSFDSDECKKMLEFCNDLEFAEEPDYETATDEEMNNYYAEQENAIRNDKALITDLNISNMREYARMKYGEFNEDMCVVGYPTSDGSGVKLSTTNGFSIMENSANKEAAWSFINEFFTEEYQTSDQNSYTLPALKSVFEKKLDETMEDPYYLDADGKKQTYKDSYYTGDESIEIPNLSKEERDELEKLILSAKGDGYVYDEDIYNIAQEEADAYFNGERSAEETLDLIQSRCSILLSEQS